MSIRVGCCHSHLNISQQLQPLLQLEIQLLRPLQLPANSNSCKQWDFWVPTLPQLLLNSKLLSRHSNYNLQI